MHANLGGWTKEEEEELKEKSPVSNKTNIFIDCTARLKTSIITDLCAVFYLGQLIIVP